MVIFKRIVLLLRAHHWTKAIFVLLGVVYADIPSYWPKALEAAFSFCLIASTVYIYNDLQDLAEDRLHPQKKFRPLASNEISTLFALNTLVLLLVVGMSLAYYVSSKLAVILEVYLFINIIYNHWLRNLPIFDALCIASGFMLRIFAGTIGIGLPITWWLSITATLLSLLIALGKRRLELNLGLKGRSRAVLKKYHPHVLTVLINSTAIFCFTTYFFYTICTHRELFYFILTLPFAAFGLWRFAWLTNIITHNDDPIAVFFSDKLSCLNAGCFFALTMMAFF